MSRHQLGGHKRSRGKNRFLQDANIQQTIIQHSFGSNFRLIAKLIGIGESYHQRTAVEGNIIIQGDGTTINLRVKIFLHRNPGISDKSTMPVFSEGICSFSI